MNVPEAGSGAGAGGATGGTDTPDFDPDCDEGSSVFWLASVQAGQMERRSAGMGSARGCSQVCPHGQVRRTVVI